MEKFSTQISKAALRPQGSEVLGIVPKRFQTWIKIPKFECFLNQAS